LIPKADPSSRQRAPAAPRSSLGVDVGATLTKLAAQDASGEMSLRVLPSRGLEAAVGEIEALAPERLGLTGAGAAALAARLPGGPAPMVEFAAWHAGAQELLARQGVAPVVKDLLVALGTGTSVLLVEPERYTRVGGTALGGGTLLGLGAALVGTADFEEFTALAAGGDRRRVDLLVSDIDPTGALPLPGELTAACFARLAQPSGIAGASRSDLAHALLGLVGDHVALLCAVLAALTGAQRILFGGSPLRGNPHLRRLLAGAAAAGREVIFLADGEFAGAVGALRLAQPCRTACLR
jgi:type II pantothenate kinase